MGKGEDKLSVRNHMPVERQSITVHVRIDGFGFYLTAGMYDDGRLGEIYVKGAGKEGSTVQGLLDAWATSFSMNLQAGLGLDDLVRKFSGMRFAPMGYTDHPEIPKASSLIDFVCRWISIRWGSEDLRSKMEADRAKVVC